MHHHQGLEESIAQMTTVEIPAEEFARTNRGLINVLKAVAESGNDGIPTRKLLYKIKMIGYGETLIKCAESLQYIKRERREPQSGVGFHPVYNILTPKGKKLLAQLSATTVDYENFCFRSLIQAPTVKREKSMFLSSMLSTT